MSSYGQQFLSKVIDSGDLSAFTRCGITREHFVTAAEKSAVDYVFGYADTNGGRTPSYATFAAENPDVMYIPDVTDEFTFLARELKDSYGKRQFAELINKEVGGMYETMRADELISSLQDRLESIKIGVRTNVPIGNDITLSGERFMTEYRSRKEGRSFKIWPSKFPTINVKTGGYLSGNMYTWYARPGRGKSVITMEEAIESAFHGAVVLIWALEMSTFEWMARAYSSISARSGVATATVAGVDYTAGFDNLAMLMGRLPEDFERGLEEFVTTLNDVIPGRIILRAIDEADFSDNSIRQLEADILETKADVVVIDPIYYMEFESNTSKTAGGDVAATSKRIRKLAGKTGSVIHVITQADENAAEKGDDGVRELKPPKRAEIKKTKAVLEDAAVTFGIDTINEEGRGIIELGKGRSGGEDTRVELIYLPNYGIVRELVDTGGAETGQFVGIF